MKLDRFLFLLLFVGLIVLPGHSAQAQTRVGEAAVVKNQVVHIGSAGSHELNVGDGVLRDETVRTGPDSATRLVLADSTNLSLGASATIVLDRTVFDDQNATRALAINIASGAARFVTGHMDKAAYTITTPLATIGVRGTILDILSQPAQTIVSLQEGASRVCTKGGACIELLLPGDTAIINLTNGKITIQKTNTPPWTFAAGCAAAAGLCNVTQFADAGSPDDPSTVLCGK
jgi:hypothetical protein